jgi:6-phosphogluconolactonase (cycloisomerase 2 family)
MTDIRSWLAYVGCRTTRERKASGLGLSVYRIDGGGEWRQLQLVEGLRNPSYLCVHPAQPRLYAVHGDFSEISTFAIGADGLLAKLSEQGTQGFNPVHLALTPSRRWLLVANYASGNVASMRVAEDGTLGAIARVLRLPGAHGPRAQQEASHPHQICFSPDGRHALVPDKGLDAVFSLFVNEDTGHLRIAAISRMPVGSGPRHMTLHPRLPIAYVVGELDRTVLTARYDVANGNVEVLGSISSVPPEVVEGSAAGIVLAADTRHLFVSNRGHDSVAIYPVDDAGHLGAAEWIAAGKTPRFITSFPADGSLVAAMEEGHCIAALRGVPSAFKDLAQTGSPVCIVFRKVNP